MKHAIIATLALVTSVFAASQVASAKDEMKIGEKVKIGDTTVKVDTNADGSTTVRPNATSGLSITGKSIPNTRGNPSGGFQGTISVTKEW